MAKHDGRLPEGRDRQRAHHCSLGARLCAAAPPPTHTHSPPPRVPCTRQVTVRFPRFTESAFYDPALAYVEGPSSGAAVVLRAWSWTLALLAAFVTNILQTA